MIPQVPVGLSTVGEVTLRETIASMVPSLADYYEPRSLHPALAKGKWPFLNDRESSHLESIPDRVLSGLQDFQSL